ncbi:MAG: hypothetical protein HYX87_02975 [Chloroflexi bacterium]|nr:hypothetical protein [Chloroflexota bacterium]
MGQTEAKRMAMAVEAIRKAAEELKARSNGNQAVIRNVDRILANVRMLEINVCDLVDVIG